MPHFKSTKQSMRDYQKKVKAASLAPEQEASGTGEANGTGQLKQPGYTSQLEQELAHADQEAGQGQSILDEWAGGTTGLGDGMGDSGGLGDSDTADEYSEWFEQAAADFLAKPSIDPTMQEILDLTKAFTRKNFSLRAGLLFRQQLQNTPDYETVVALEDDLLAMAGEADCLGSVMPVGSGAQSPERVEQQRRLVKWAVESLAPRIAGSKVVKVTRSTKKPKNILAQCPTTLLTQLGMKYKELLEHYLQPQELYDRLAHSVAGENVRVWLGEYTGRDTAPQEVLISLLWTKKEQKQWIYGLVEYAAELVELVMTAMQLDPDLRPSKYLCYFQKKSEATLYQGQEELEQLIKNMQADNLLPEYETGEADWQTSASNAPQPVQPTPQASEPPQLANEPAQDEPGTLAGELEAEPALVERPKEMSALDRIRARSRNQKG